MTEALAERSDATEVWPDLVSLAEGWEPVFFRVLDLGVACAAFVVLGFLAALLLVVVFFLAVDFFDVACLACAGPELFFVDFLGDLALLAVVSGED